MIVRITRTYITHTVYTLLTTYTYLLYTYTTSLTTDREIEYLPIYLLHPTTYLSYSLCTLRLTGKVCVRAVRWLFFSWQSRACLTCPSVEEGNLPPAPDSLLLVHEDYILYSLTLLIWPLVGLKEEIGRVYSSKLEWETFGKWFLSI